MLQSLFQKNNTPDTRRPTASRSPVPPKLTLLITIVNREKGDSYLAMLQSFEVNFQLAMAGQGTASAEILKYLGLSHTDKAVIFSVIREDRADAAMHFLEEKFRTLKNGKGIAFTVPMTGMIGVAAYQFLSNNVSERGVAL